MKSFANLRKPVYSGLTFFSTILVLSVGYATYTGITSSEYAVWAPLTSSLMDKVVKNMDDLDTRINSVGSSITSLTTSLNSLVTTVSTINTTPAGAVMAFDLVSCPSGWTEYTQAYGRFIRGIDKSGSSIDPDGARAKGSTQADAFASHTHSVVNPAWWTFRGGSGSPYGAGAGGNWLGADGSSPSIGSAWWANETRPKNVALLYCRKN